MKEEKNKNGKIRRGLAVWMILTAIALCAAGCGQGEVEEGEKAKEKLQVKYDIDSDFKFGFDGLYELVSSAVEVIQNKEVTNKSVEESVNANLLSSIRG